MFYCVYIGNWKVSNTARDVHWGVKQASRVQNSRFSLAIHNCRLSADRSLLAVFVAFEVLNDEDEKTRKGKDKAMDQKKG